MTTLQLDEVMHEYMADGRRVPSVTGILDPVQELDGIPRHLLDAAARFGRHVHRACHLDNLGVLDMDTLSPPLIPYVQGWRKFKRETGVIIIASELMVHHPRLGYAGTLDAAIAWKRDWRRHKYATRHVLDIKSSAKVPCTVGPQTEAYRAAYNACKTPPLAPTRYCCHLKDDGSYSLVTLTERADWNLFLSALNIHNWRQRHGLI